MRDVCIALFMGASVVSSCAQEIPQKNVPSVVVNAFMTSYPQATDIEWEQQGTLYNVEFEIGKVDHEIGYDASGKMIRHEEEMAPNNLPVAVIATIQKNFPGYKPDDAYRVEENGKLFYKVELDGNIQDRVLHISPEGTVLDNKIDY